MDLKILAEGAVSISSMGKVFVADLDGVIHTAEEDITAVLALLKLKLVAPVADLEKAAVLTSEQLAAADAAKVEAAAQEMIKSDEFRAKVLARAAELVGTATDEAKNESAELTIAATNAATVAATKKGR